MRWFPTLYDGLYILPATKRGDSSQSCLRPATLIRSGSDAPGQIHTILLNECPQVIWSNMHVRSQPERLIDYSKSCDCIIASAAVFSTRPWMAADEKDQPQKRPPKVAVSTHDQCQLRRRSEKAHLSTASRTTRPSPVLADVRTNSRPCLAAKALPAHRSSAPSVPSNRYMFLRP